VALLDAGHDVPLVITAPPRRRGRGVASTPSPVEAVARARGAEVAYRPEVLASLGPELRIELGIVVAFGQLIKDRALRALPLINVHFSLLPAWRGAAPVERAILAGETTTGISLMAIDEGLDTGPLYRVCELEIGAEETAGELHTRLQQLGSSMTLELLEVFADLGLPAAMPQHGEPSYAAKLTSKERELDWSAPAVTLHRAIRVGRASTIWRSKRLIVHRAALVLGEHPRALADAPPGTLAEGFVQTGSGVLRLVELQQEGRVRQSFEEWARGARPLPGEQLGAPDGPGSERAAEGRLIL